MKYLKIQNNGELDIRLVALMGGTTKAKDAYKIGQFGTGLKYTLAYLFRNNLDFKIFIGNEQVVINLEFEEIRGERFEIICINGHRTSITTKMGEEWQAWMIIRELWCNALDEGDALREEVEACTGTEGSTTFYIQIDSAIAEVVERWDHYFISKEIVPIFSNKNYRLYEPSDSLRLYKNGVLIYENKNIKSVFSYDILAAHINELREYRNAPACDISKAIKEMTSEGINYFIDHLNKECFEYQMDYDWFTEWAGHWDAVISTIKIMTPSVKERYSEYSDTHSSELMIKEVPENLYRSLNNHFQLGDSLKIDENVQEFFPVGDAATQEKINMALSLLKKCGYEVSEALSFKIGFYSNENNSSIALHNKSVFVPIGMKLTHIQLLSEIVRCNESFINKIDGPAVRQHFISLYTRALLANGDIELPQDKEPIAAPVESAHHDLPF